MSLEPKTADAQYTMGGDAVLAIDRKGSIVHADVEGGLNHGLPSESYEDKPTEEEFETLRRVPGSLPGVAYAICAVEFAERSSYYGVQPLITNFVNRPLPTGGNGWGAPPNIPGNQSTAGALGLGTVKATAVGQSFSMIAYAMPVFFGWLADTKTGRFNLVCGGVLVFGIAHILMVVAGSKSLLASGAAVAPYLISVYILALGAAMFKPCISPILLDQMTNSVPTTQQLKSGEKVIVDPEATTERVMLWFYLIINIGGFMNVPTAYTEKYVGWWLSFLLPLLLYLPLPFLLFFLRKRLILHPPGGSDLGNVFRVLGFCFKRNGIRSIGKGFWNVAKPSVIAQSTNPVDVPWDDNFVNDVRRTFQATGIFCFFPIQFINDNGLGASAGAMSSMLTTNGVPNDVISNFNSLSIILMAPILNYGLYPLFRKYRIDFGPIKRITFGLFLSSVGGVGYTVLNYYAYKVGPCGNYGTSLTCVDAEGNSLVAPITIWWLALPYALGGISELFVNVPAYGIAYSRAPKNMKGLVSALNLFNTAIAYALGLALAGIVRDPFLTWDLGVPAIIGFVATGVFYWCFHELDREEFVLNQQNDEYDSNPLNISEIGDEKHSQIGDKKVNA